MCDKKRTIFDRKARQPSVKVALDSRGHCDICSYNIIAFRDKLIKLIRNIWPNWFDLINWIELNLALSIYHIQTSGRKSARIPAALHFQSRDGWVTREIPAYTVSA